ncbi:MAG UNVERIFIED_CONTAM: FHA domain-containing protein [Planctomycetaceae bacterium]
MFRLLAFHGGRRVEREFFLEDGRLSVLGRGTDCDISTPWDPQISVRHVQVTPAGNEVLLSCLSGVVNRVYVEGQAIDSTQLQSGQSFVIGASRFELQRLTLADSPGTPLVVRYSRWQSTGVSCSECVTTMPRVESKC